jgi:hypothetical protein
VRNVEGYWDVDEAVVLRAHARLYCRELEAVRHRGGFAVPAYLTANEGPGCPLIELTQVLSVTFATNLAKVA